MSQTTEDRFDPGVPHSSFSSCCTDGRGGLGLEDRRDGPAARVRLRPIAAKTSPALLKTTKLEGAWARGPQFRSATACSTIARPWWLVFGVRRGQWGVREHPW
jgi:hypothetical protein